MDGSYKLIIVHSREDNMNSEPKFGFILEYVEDIDAARKYYEEVLGKKVARVSPRWIQFEDHLAIGSDESLGGGREMEVYWLVDDADAAYMELSGKVEVVLPLEGKPYGKVFGIKGPSGRPLYMVEFAKDRPTVAV
jgi:catechol 2,3-dioxygenase-like lactoylglutathione lyase family enzyme